MKKILILIIAVITVSVLLVSSTVFASSSTMPSNVSESGEEGPPPWAGGPKAEQRQQWSESGEEGPPPWAASRGKKQDV